MKPPSSVKLMLKNDLRSGGEANPEKSEGRVNLDFYKLQAPAACGPRLLYEKRLQRGDDLRRQLIPACQSPVRAKPPHVAQVWLSNNLIKAINLNKFVNRSFINQNTINPAEFSRSAERSLSQEVFAKSMVGVWIGPLHQVPLGFLPSCHYVHLLCEGMCGRADTPPASVTEDTAASV